MIGGILFLSCLFVCVFVCLSVVNTNLCYNFWTIRDRDSHFIYGMYTPLMIPFQLKPRSMTLWPWLLLLNVLKIAFSDLIVTGDIMFHKHMYFSFLDQGHIVFRRVCLSVVIFNLHYNFWTKSDRDFIFGMHTLITPFRMTPRWKTLKHSDT